ncbi:unnamed protein product [Pelagomonas calceolata]|uniref:Uncharacterized protein n=1 Tax=Pelagomonas calceolata TaxID=35677 RepID=A0A8J2WWI0_9STRA|nr:unnamed protein product [Pelagomonas calceolata]|mmetsp:Transcript_23149/g.60512  ORF Transcript_23149/g.60512 Transcript_23149/m.60512 type:complete len:972 (-) Transcript_23149:20-2935(-)
MAQDKKKRKASTDATKPKRQKLDSAFLDLFWQLASASKKARTAAAAALDDALQQDASKAPYALKRLLGGLASPRDGARAGCACALAQLLRSEAVTADAVKEGCQTLYVRGGSSRQDKRDANAQDLGELLAAECLSRSGSCDAATALYFCGRALDLLKRKWLRELAARVFAGLIRRVDDDKDINQRLDALLASGLDADLLALALSAKRPVEDTDLTCLGAAAAQLFPRLHVAWELLIEDDYARVASVVDELAKSSSVERRGAALLVAAQALERGVSPSIVLTDAVAPSLLSAAARGDAALGPVAGRALKRVVGAASDKPLEVATLLLARGGAHASSGAGGKAVVALVEACDDADFAKHVKERAATAAAGDASALTALAALARGPRGAAAFEALLACAARVAFFGEAPIQGHEVSTVKCEADDDARRNAASIIYAALADRLKAAPLEAGGAALAPLEAFCDIVQELDGTGLERRAPRLEGSAPAGSDEDDAMTVVLRSLALLAVCLLDDTAPQGVERPATAKAVLDDLEQALELRRAGDATDSESLLIARAAVALLGCAHAHGASRLARELVKRAWGLSCAQAPPSAAAYRVILCAVTGEEEDDDDEEDESEEEDDEEESMMDESDVSDSEMMAGRDSVGFSELGDDVPLEDGDDIEVKGDDVMALLEEVDGEDARKERDAHRKAGRTDARRAELQLRLRALDLLERCSGEDEALRALAPLSSLAAELETDSAPEAADLANRLGALLRGRIGKAASKADDAAAAAATTTVLLTELRSRKRGPFADAAQAALNACAAVLRRGTDVQAHATAANAYEGAATEAFGSKKAKVPTKILKDCASKAPNIAAAAFLDKLPGWAAEAPSPFLAGEALALLDALAGRASEKHAAAAFTALASLARDERFRKADRARALLETAKALAKARPGADASDFAAAATALADGHPSQAVRGLAAQFAASLPTTAPVKKTKKKRKSAK